MCLAEESPSTVTDVADAPSLWRLLVAVSGAGGELPSSTAIETFQRLHGEGQQPGAYDSALLLCTDWRWYRMTARVLAGIVETELLTGDELDRLAKEFLWSDLVAYQHPTGWFGDRFVELVVDSDRRISSQRTVRIDPDLPMTTSRQLRPPLRKWAAARLLTRGLATLATLHERARALAPQDGAAVIAGVVGAAADGEQARTAIDIAVRWPHQAPRKAALKQLVAWGEVERAQRLAAEDPDGALRAWGRKLRDDTTQATGGQDGLF